MSTVEKKLYQQIQVNGGETSVVPSSKSYRGISTVNPDATSPLLYDLNLIKQDIINHFHIRQGEKLQNPEFGTIIWDVLYDPLTEDLRDAIANNVTEIVNYDPRVQVDEVIVSSYESGIQIELELTYLPYNISEKMRLQFDEDSGLY